MIIAGVKHHLSFFVTGSHYDVWTESALTPAWGAFQHYRLMAVFDNRRDTCFAGLDTAATINIDLTTLYSSSCAVIVVCAFVGLTTFPWAILKETRRFVVLFQMLRLSFLYPSFF